MLKYDIIFCKLCSHAPTFAPVMLDHQQSWVLHHHQGDATIANSHIKIGLIRLYAVVAQGKSCSDSQPPYVMLCNSLDYRRL